MPIEEIVLTLPESDSKAESSESPAAAALKNQGDELVRQFRQLLAEKRRVALTARARARREEVFDTGCMSLVKQLARESTAGLRDRKVRIETRSRIYTSVRALLSATIREQDRLILQKRLAGRTAILLGVLSAVSTGGVVYLSLS